MKDLYSVLGVSKGATDAEIKQAYRKLAKEFHPDRHKGDSKAAERFKEISAAYAILGDKEKRGQYDRGEIDESGAERAPHGFRNYSWEEAGGGPGGGGFRADFDPFGGGGFSAEDIFSDLFGHVRGRRSQPQRRKGRDQRYRMNVGFMDAAKGATRRLTLQNGKSLDVKIPAGIQEGQHIRLKGQGEQGIGGGPAGDLLIEVHIAEHPYFRRKGNDIHVEVPVTMKEAVLGAKIKVPTIHGEVSLRIPAGSSGGRTLRLKGKGIIIDGGKKAGDQYVKLRIELPDRIDDELQQFMENWTPPNADTIRGELE